MKNFKALFSTLAICAGFGLVSPSIATAAWQPAEKPAEKPAAESEKKSDGEKSPVDGKDGKKDEKKDKQLTGRAERVAFLNFGLPQSAQGKADSMVGREINSYAWKQVLPKLIAAKVDVVVVRINSGGGLVSEMEPFQNMFENDYKPRFRTVAWIENAISCAAMSPWPLKEMYFMPEGRIGGCTAFNGGSMQQVPPAMLEGLLAQMELTSRWAGRDYKIMRSMQIMEPLSATIDANGNIKFFQDSSGQIIVNPPGEVLTLSSVQALQVGFSSGTASTPEELMKVMGINEYEFVAKDVSEFMDRNITESDRMHKRFTESRSKYQLALGAAEQFQGDNERQDIAIGRARQALRTMQETQRTSPNILMFNNVNVEWFAEQERILKALQRR